MAGSATKRLLLSRFWNLRWSVLYKQHLLKLRGKAYFKQVKNQIIWQPAYQCLWSLNQQELYFESHSRKLYLCMLFTWRWLLRLVLPGALPSVTTVNLCVATCSPLPTTGENTPLFVNLFIQGKKLPETTSTCTNKVALEMKRRVFLDLAWPGVEHLDSLDWQVS